MTYKNNYKTFYNMHRYVYSILLGFSLIMIHTSCKKLVEIKAPATSLSEASVYSTDAAAISVLTGIYYQLSSSSYISGSAGLSLLPGLSADEFSLSNSVSINDTKYYYYIDSLFSNLTGSNGAEHWSPFYNWIFKCNAAIEKISVSNSLSGNVIKQLLGEAKFIRAFCYFHLVNLYGDIPLPLSTDWKTNSILPRVPKTQVFQQIISDLKDAQNQLSDQYLDANLQPYTNSFERLRPTKWLANALLARTYLYMGGEWANAEEQANIVINNSALFSLQPLNSVFLKNSQEAIWQLQPVSPGQNTPDGALFILPSTGPTSSFPVYLSPQLLSAFENGDKRRFGKNWIDSVIVGGTKYYFPIKYKQGKNSSITSVGQLTEYTMVFRLAEQYLIRAEARAQQNNLNGAADDLNVLRSATRANLPLIVPTTQSAMLTAIAHERQVELFSEWGHRWFDLKRTGTVNAIMSVVRPQKTNGASWQAWMQLYPILFYDMQKNLSLTQNPGYN